MEFFVILFIVIYYHTDKIMLHLMAIRCVHIKTRIIIVNFFITSFVKHLNIQELKQENFTHCIVAMYEKLQTSLDGFSGYSLQLIEDILQAKINFKYLTVILRINKFKV